MKILIATGIYPPDIGGPARYAKGLEDAFRGLGHEVKVLAYRMEKKLPWGIRQVFYLSRIFAVTPKFDAIIALDTVSVGFPAVIASFLWGKKIAIRTGGDFLWETYLERTGLSMPLPYFYKVMPHLSIKEKIIEKIHQFILDYTDFIVFSTSWQRDIWTGFYNINKNKIRVIENRYYEKREGKKPTEKVFLGAARRTAMKNLEFLEDGFKEANKKIPGIKFDLGPYTPDEYEEKLKSCYAVAVVSLGDISPNSIMEAISYNKPFILTKYNGIKDRIGDLGIVVDPLIIKDISKGFTMLSDDKIYEKEVEKLKKFSFVHSYRQIADEFLGIIDHKA